MFSIIFFGFVFFILVAGLATVMFRRRKKALLKDNGTTERNHRMPHTSGFKEPSADDRNGLVAPADNKRSQQNYGEQEQSREEGSMTDRSAS